MIVGIGTDLVEIDRFEQALSRQGIKLINRFFTEKEKAYCQSFPNPVSRFAVRFAAKEAFSKAIGTGIARGIKWTDVEVHRSESGQPTLILEGRAQEFVDRLGGKRIWVTLTHTKNVAGATVIIEK